MFGLAMSAALVLYLRPLDHVFALRRRWPFSALLARWQLLLARVRRSDPALAPCASRQSS